MSGHTLRAKCPCGWCARISLPTFAANNRPKVKHENGWTEVAITDIDALFDDGFVLHGNDHSMNKNNRWEEVEEQLQRLSVHTLTTFNRKEFRWQTTYRLPIIGYKLFEDMSTDVFSFGCVACVDSDGKVCRKSELKLKNDNHNYLLWNGQYYDVNYAYWFDGFRLKRAFPLQNDPPHFPEKDPIEKLGKLRMHNRFRERIVPWQASLNHITAGNSSRHQFGGWTPRGENDFLELDLGEPQFVTHIGTAGKFPTLDNFPKKKDVGKKKYRLFRMAKGKYANYVYIVEDDVESMCWVEEYEVFYRHAHTNKWVSIGLFKGNADATTEYVNELFQHFNTSGGLYTRFLRIKPTNNFHNQPTMRVAVYARSKTHFTVDNQPKQEQQQQLIGTYSTSTTTDAATDAGGLICTAAAVENSANSAELDTAVESSTVSYVLAQGSTTANGGGAQVRIEGTPGGYYRDRWWYRESLEESQKHQRRSLRADISQALKEHRKQQLL